MINEEEITNMAEIFKKFEGCFCDCILYNGEEVSGIIEDGYLSTNDGESDIDIEDIQYIGNITE